MTRLSAALALTLTASCNYYTLDGKTSPLVVDACGTSPDAPPDAAPDAPPDAAPDAPPDAAPDAPPDAAPDPYAVPWTRHTILAGVSTGPLKGADGLDLATIAGADAFLVPWEQGGGLTVSTGGTNYTIATGLYGAEDARWADFDGDGKLDAATARDADARVHITFQNSALSSSWTTILLTGSQGHNRWMQLAVVDMNADGYPDLVGGTRAGTGANPAVIAWLENPGPSSARTGSAWTYHYIDIAGWAMSVIPRDVDADGDYDLVVSDRSFYMLPNNTTHYNDRKGVRWIENTGSGWTNHTIAVLSEPGFLWIGDWNGTGGEDIITGSVTPGSSNITIRENNGWTGTWTNTTITQPTGVGAYEAAAVADVDGDGRKDIVISTTKGGTCCISSEGVYWLQNTASGFMQRTLSGYDGTKFDQMLLRDMDGDGDPDDVTNEQVGNNVNDMVPLGLVWYENPR